MGKEKKKRESECVKRKKKNRKPEKTKKSRDANWERLFIRRKREERWGKCNSDTERSACEWMESENEVS